MRKYLIVIFIFLFFIPVIQAGQLDGKKILMIIAPENFSDEEYQVPRELFEKEGAEITVASSGLNISKGMLGLEVKPDILIGKVKADEFSAIVFVGGVGAQGYWENKEAHRIAKQAVEQNKVLGAICLAPGILAKAGVLKGKRATAYSSVKKEIIEGGGKYIGSAVEIDGNIITGNGPTAAEIFAKDIIEVLLKK